MSGQVVNEAGVVEVKGVEVALQGELIREEMGCAGYTNGVNGCWIYIPEYAKGKKNLGLMVLHDGLNKLEAYALDNLVKTGEVPPSVIIGVEGGMFLPTIDEGYRRYMRPIAYDVLTPLFADWVVDEVVPYFVKKYNLDISDSPDMHAVMGGSSGGLSSWTLAWERNDFFHRVYMSSPSFLAMANGDAHLKLIRKCETKPLRVFSEYSESEPDNFFGSSFNVADAAERALKYSGYDAEFRYYPGEGHCSRGTDPDSAIERQRCLWKNWDSQPVTVKNQSRIADLVIEMGEGWQRTDAPFPEKVKAVSTGRFTAKGEYTANGSDIIFTDQKGVQTVVADGFGEITALLISCDKWRLYVGDKIRGCGYTMPILPDGKLGGRIIHGYLEKKTDFEFPGVFDMCLDSEDRLYAATEMGIQCIRGGGLVDLILENPEGRTPVDKIEMGDDGCLYALCGDRVYRRKLKDKKPVNPEEITEPTMLGY